MDIWAFFNICDYEKSYFKYSYTIIFGHRFSLLLGKYLGVIFLRVPLFLKTAKLLLQSDCIFYTPTHKARESQLLLILTILGIFTLLCAEIILDKKQSPNSVVYNNNELFLTHSFADELGHYWF